MSVWFVTMVTVYTVIYLTTHNISVIIATKNRDFISHKTCSALWLVQSFASYLSETSNVVELL